MHVFRINYISQLLSMSHAWESEQRQSQVNVVGRLSYFGRCYQVSTDKEESILREALKWLIFSPNYEGDFQGIELMLSHVDIMNSE